MSEYFPPGVPLFSKATYEKWIAENRCTPAQRERYRDAIDWYNTHKENENARKPAPTNPLEKLDL